MEALLFLGMLGSGYIYNNIKKEEPAPLQTPQTPQNKPPPIKDIVQRNPVYGIMNTPLNQTFIDTNITNDSKLRNYNIISNKKIIKPGRMRSTNNQKITSEISNEQINKMDFLTNDQGIRVQPFFKGNGPGNTNINNNSMLMAHMGNDIKMKKQEVAPQFAPTKNSGNVFGMTYEGPVADKNRYDPGKFKTNELPYEKIYVPPIDEKSGANGDIMRIAAERGSIENTRTLNNQRNTYEGRVNSGKYIDKRGFQAHVDKNRPYRDYKNSPLRNFTTVAETEAAALRPEEILKPTNRSYLNKQELGIASSNGLCEDTKRPMVQRTKKKMLVTSTDRNVKGEHERSIDYNLLGYVAPANERQVTEERTYEGNLKTYISESTIGLQDPVKKTLKQTTLYSDNRNPSTYISEDTSRINYCNMETDPSKEIISKGRAPTLSNVKLTNGKDTVNMDIHKLDSDYITQHGTNISKIYGKIPSDFKCQITQDKYTLDNDKLSDRIYPELLDPFRENPLTQSLSSFAYN